MVNPLRNDITNNNQQSLGNQHYSTTAHYRKELFPTSRAANILNTPSPNRKHLLSRTPITGSAARVPVKNSQTPIATGIKAPPMRTPVLSSCLKNRDASRTEMVTVSATKTLRWADCHRLSQNS
ncbi:unnamed protein product [Lymnaea stagnalis]|uniref:Uncharacterized protein n=1 Tax=Lymnaea stagnalis TaxID=6523 RepID=A0AAV2HJT5_LYMST